MSSWLAKDGTTTMVGSARCVHTADSVRCDGFAYTPSGYCVEHAQKCACGMIWPNCDCPGETLADLDLYDAKVKAAFSPALARWVESGRLVAGEPKVSD